MLARKVRELGAKRALRVGGPPPKRPPGVGGKSKREQAKGTAEGVSRPR